MFAAKLRLPQSTPDKEKHERVAELLELLGLSHVADGIIGKEGRRGISGGERKRVSIGVELITSPDVLFLGKRAGFRSPATAACSDRICRVSCLGRGAQEDCPAGTGEEYRNFVRFI